MPVRLKQRPSDIGVSHFFLDDFFSKGLSESRTTSAKIFCKVYHKCSCASSYEFLLLYSAQLNSERTDCKLAASFPLARAFIFSYL